MEPENNSSKGMSFTIPDNMATPVAIVIAGIIVAAAVYFSHGATAPTTQQPTGQQPATTVDSNKISTEGDPVIGKATAAVTVAYFFDYQCPFCKQVEQTVMQNVIRDYVDTGKVKLVYKDFAFLGADSFTAAAAARAVWEVAPDKFVAWHDAMFNKQDTENGGWGNKADILALTASLGIDSAKVDALMTKNADAYQKETAADTQEGQTLGITGTPAFIIGNHGVAGAQTYDVVKGVIDQALAGK